MHIIFKVISIEVFYANMLGNLIKYAFSEGVAKLAPFFTTLYVAKFISVESFGKYSLVIVAYELFFILISFNIQATTRIDYFKLTRASFLNSKRQHLIICFFLAIFISILSSASNEYAYILILLVFSSLTRCISVFQLAVYQCEKSASKYVISNLTFTISLSVFTLIFVNTGCEYLSWLYGLLLASLFQLVVSSTLFGYVRTVLFLSFNRVDFNLDSFKSTFVIALLFLPQALGWWLKLGADRWVIEQGLGASILGEYSLAFQFASVLLIAATVINLVLVPELNVSLKNCNIKRIKILISSAILFLVLLSFIVNYAGVEVIRKVYDFEYKNSIQYLEFLIFPFLVQSFVLIFSNLLYYLGKGAFMAKIILVTFTLQIAINYFFVEYFHVSGMILVSLFANVIVFMLIVVKSIIELKRELKSYLI
ncbi:oligosaccharide flippase family protein [Shewanella zhangzhouensis]|uniref:oligosaccharide flippase family protein n=1 Tax=Shewanella zhangzhouensis TaxID=2864213 RepID=UPI001C660AE2|nr:oligosaccharide flippase family protein [Shewanella zhangzhouensis]QYK03918.1 oligosaccharide flippase family protein [Shewanella zhangzhouensis]